MELIETKICAMLSLGLGSMIAGLIPAWFSNHGRNNWPLLLSSLLCVGAGVLLSTSLVHLLPEVREMLVGYESYAEILFCGGFFLLYLTDEIVHFIKENSRHVHYGFRNENVPIYDGITASNSSNNLRNYGSVIEDARQTNDYNQRQLPYNPSFGKAWNENDLVPSQLCHVAHQEPCDVSHVGTFGLLMALSIHSLLEGIVIGTEPSANKVFLMLGAIAAHKLVVAFCLGIEVAASPTNTACKHFVSIAIFSFGSVLGIGVGMFATEIPKKLSNLTVPILQALAGGTLLYVTMCEVLPRERARWHQQHRRKCAGMSQLLSVIIGFVGMTISIKYLRNILKADLIQMN